MSNGLRLLSPSIILGGLATALAAALVPAQASQLLVTRAVDERQTVELTGNLRPEANTVNDRGAVADSLKIDHMQLLLKRPADTEAALDKLIDDLHDPASASFHRWLNAGEFRTQFGPAESDLSAVTTWLTRHGFQVHTVVNGGMVVDFSGTAGQVREAFHTEIHKLDVAGVSHIANMSNPRIPAALSGIVNGVVSLHDFRPHTNYHSRGDYTFTANGSTYEAVVPADLATIYNFNPLFRAGLSGQGQTIVVIEDTNVYAEADWAKFRSTFGLTAYKSGSFTQVHPVAPVGSNNCIDPGVLPFNEAEAEIDAEWSSAAAPSAAIELASCRDSGVTFGGLIAFQNLMETGNPPAIVSISYGECETINGASNNAAYASAYKQAVALGVSVFVSSGDEGADSCDANQSIATHGIGVSAFASTPYNVAVGGTDFGDNYAGTASTYWSSTNGGTYGSALSYVPEIPWNDSCASVLIATFLGYSTTYGSSGFCNSTTGEGNLTTASGSGGPSGCATGTPSVSGVVSGTCKGYPKPVWQSLLGNPSDGVRDIPDVALFAANGIWGHYYVVCDSDAGDGLPPCTGAPDTWAGFGGTSVSTPIMAGIQALVNQKTGVRQGNPNPVYYKLAIQEYGRTGSSLCNSTRGNAVGPNCVFNDVTLGDMDINCTGSNNCFLPTGTNGVLSLSDKAYVPAYGAKTGWDFPSGIGSVNATNLVNNW